MLQRLSGKIALVTGSTNGIGLAIAERLALDGAKVVVSSRKPQNVEKTVKDLVDKGYDVTGVPCHVGNKEDRMNLVKHVEKIGGLDIFVQSAGVNPNVAPLLDFTESQWDKTFDVNLKASWMLTKELQHLLKQSKAGRVIYNSSVSGLFPLVKLGAYPVAKSALITLTKSMALNLGPWNVTVNCLVPGLIQTPFGKVLEDDKDANDVIALGALKRYGKPHELGGIAAFLASEESNYITGEAICVTGGFPFR